MAILSSGAARVVFHACIAAASLLFASTCANADTGTFSVLHDFANSPDGVSPDAAVGIDAAGNVYGTTFEGGDPTCFCGIVFKIAPGGAESILLTFTGANGATAYSAPVVDKSGNVYGTTYAGGVGQDGGQGTIFKIAANGSATSLYSFCTTSNCPDGGNPVGNLIMDKRGNLYGIGQEGGVNGSGVLFEYTAGGTEKVLYSFDYSTSGGAPDSTIVQDAAGNFYGTAYGGGAGGCGTIFEVTPKGKETTLYAFACGNDGRFPNGLTIDASGNLFGTTQLGGKSGYGTVWELPAGGTEKVLYAFANGAGGAMPFGPLARDSKGNLYGTASGGGTGAGTLFKISPKGKETVLHTFAPDGSDGSLPSAGLVYHKGAFYGTAVNGGAGNGCGANACGTVFKYVK
jgi:uncharacterized repeat protein (TIGR03803 family)